MHYQKLHQLWQRIEQQGKQFAHCVTNGRSDGQPAGRPESDNSNRGMQPLVASPLKTETTKGAILALCLSLISQKRFITPSCGWHQLTPRWNLHQYHPFPAIRSCVLRKIIAKHQRDGRTRNKWKTNPWLLNPYNAIFYYTLTNCVRPTKCLDKNVENYKRANDRHI